VPEAGAGVVLLGGNVFRSLAIHRLGPSYLTMILRRSSEAADFIAIFEEETS